MAGINKKIIALTEGVLSTFTDAALFSLFWVGASVGKSGPQGVNRAFEEALGELESTNYHTLKQTFYRMRKQGLVRQTKRKREYTIAITDKGIRRLLSRLPVSNETGGNKIFLVTYDIPETNNLVRDRLRYLLKIARSVMLQRSVWITPHDPRKKLREFVKKNRVDGSIIVSDIGSDGMIGGERVKDLINKLFPLQEVNRRYGNLAMEAMNKPDLHAREVIRYLSIVKDDPDLPSSFLPNSWKKNKARKNILHKAKKRKKRIQSILDQGLK